jgi:hypothetical protein
MMSCLQDVVLLIGSVQYMTQPGLGKRTRLVFRDEWKCEADVWKNVAIYSLAFASATLFEF